MMAKHIVMYLYWKPKKKLTHKEIGIRFGLSASGVLQAIRKIDKLRLRPRFDDMIKEIISKCK